MSYPNNPPVPASITVDTTASINSGLVGFWPLTDGTGTTATDLSTGGNDGTQSGGVSWASTEKGTAASFDGTDDRIDSSLGRSPYPCTLSAWVNMDSITTGHVVVSVADSTVADQQIRLICGATGVQANVFNGSTYLATSGTAVSTGEWHFLTAVFDSATSRHVYVDGVLADSDTATATLTNSHDRCTIGVSADSTPFGYTPGDIQNVRVYNRALTATEVAELYSVPWTGTDYVAQNLTPDTPIAMGVDPNHSLSSGLVGYWPLSDGSGTTARNLIEEYPGTLNGTAAFVDTAKGTAITLDGNSDYVTFGSIGETVGKFTSSSAVTASIDFKLNGIPAASAIYILGTVYLSAGQSVYVLGIGESSGTATIFGAVRSQIGDAYTQTEYVGLETGRWYNASIVGDLVAGTVKLYLNGKEVDSVTPTFGSTTFVDNNDQINYDAIGARTFTGDRYFDGEVSNYRLYNRALSATEVEALYNEPWAGVVTAKSAPPQYLTLDTADSINTGLLGFWPLSDGSGTTAVDLSANGNDGTASGSATFGSTSLGVAADYDGSASFHWLADSFSYTTELTVSCWLRSDGTGVEQPAFCRGRSNDCTWWLGINASDQIRFATKRSGLYRFDHSVTSISDWHHLVFVQRSLVPPGIEAYVDGVSVSSSNGIGAFNSVSRIPILGAGTLSSSTPPTSIEDFEGNVSNARIWNRALSAAEVSRLYQDPWAGTDRAIEPSPTVKDLDTSSSLTTNLVGWWPLTEFGPQDTLAYDISVNGNHGVANGGVQRQFTDTVRAATFDGVDDYFDTGSNTIVTSFPITVSAWVSPGAATRDVIFGSFRATGTSRSFQCEINSAGRMEMISSSDGTFQATNKVTGTTTLPSGSFSHVVFVFEGSGGSLYLNGSAESSSGSLFSSLNTPVVDCLIGAEGQSGSTAHHFDGNIQNVRVYSRALSAAEVQTLYDDPWVGLATGSLVYAYYSAAFLQRLG